MDQQRPRIPVASLLHPAQIADAEAEKNSNRTWRLIWVLVGAGVLILAPVAWLAAYRHFGTPEPAPVAANAEPESPRQLPASVKPTPSLPAASAPLPPAETTQADTKRDDFGVGLSDLWGFFAKEMNGGYKFIPIKGKGGDGNGVWAMSQETHSALSFWARDQSSQTCIRAEFVAFAQPGTPDRAAADFVLANLLKLVFSRPEVVKAKLDQLVGNEPAVFEFEGLVVTRKIELRANGPQHTIIEVPE